MARRDAQQAPVGASVGGYAWYALAILVLVYVVNFVDRQMLAILVGDIKRDLLIGDAQIGFLYGTAFAVFYALFGIPFGRLADRWYRGRLIGIGLATWSSMTMLSAFANSFTTLTLARIGVGIGEASASPAAFSMISDYFPKRRRATALSIYSAGLYIGGGLSLPLGGLVVSRWSAAFPDPAEAPLGLAGWQAAFLLIGLPGLLLAIWVFSLREPPRGASDGVRSAGVQRGAWADFGRELSAILPPLTLLTAARSPGGLRLNLAALLIVACAAFGMILLTGDAAQWCAYGIGVYAVISWTQSLKHRDRPTYELIFATPEVVLLAVAFGSIAFVSYANGFWFAHYAEQTFYADAGAAARIFRGMTAREEIGVIIGTSAAAAAATGVILGGYISDRWRQHDARARLFVNMLSVALPIPLVVYMLTTRDPAAFYWALAGAQILSSLWVGAAAATLQDLVLPRMRATAGATYVLGTTMVGLALGPYYAGKMAEVLQSLRGGMLSLYVITPFSLLALWLASIRLERLESNKEDRARAVGEMI